MFRSQEHQKHQQSQYKLPIATKSIIKVHDAPIYVIKFNKNGQYCMTGSEDRSVVLYKPSQNLIIKNYKNLHNYEINGLDINKDNSKFITGGGDKIVMVTDVIQGKYIRKFTGHTNRVNTVCYNPENNIIISGSYDMTVKIWDNRDKSYSPIETLKLFKDSVTQVQANDYEIICGSMDGSVTFFDIRKGEMTSDKLSQGVQRFAMSNSGRAYAMSATNGRIYLVERFSGKKVQQFYGHTLNNYTVDCCFNYRDTHILTGSVDGSLYIYDILKQEPIKIIKSHQRTLSAIDVHQQAGYVTAGHDGTVAYWRI